MLLFGGTFDPFHSGHVHALETAGLYRVFDRICIVPVFQNPQKPNKPTQVTADRITAIEAYCRAVTHAKTVVTCEQWEIAQQRPCFFYETVAALQHQYPQSHWYLLVGADTFASLHHWQQYHTLLATLTVIVVPRHQSTVASFKQISRQTLQDAVRQRLVYIDVPAHPASATALRHHQTPCVIGITGKAGVGKTHLVAAYVQKYPNILLIDLDLIGHACLTEPNTIGTLCAQFGASILDQQGAIDRKQLGAIVFRDSAALQQLNDCVHPIIKERVMTQLNTTKSAHCMMVGALIKEIGLASLCQCTVAISAADLDYKQHASHKAYITKQQQSDAAYASWTQYQFTNTYTPGAIAEFENFIQNLFLEHTVWA